MRRPIAVLTGDIVGSTSLTKGDLSAIYAALQTAGDAIGTWSTIQHSTLFSRHRGDGWQMYLHSPQQTLRAAMVIQAHVRSVAKPFATRISIATGLGVAPDQPDLNLQTGPVYAQSGRGLDQMAPDQRLVWASTDNIAAVTRLADHISQQWTAAQAQTAAALLIPNAPTQAVAAQALGISRQAVGQAAAAAGVPALLDALQITEDAQP